MDGYAHNRMNFGNWLLGAGGVALGLTKYELMTGGHYNSVANPGTNGYHRQLDASDDQLSIRLGYYHAKGKNYSKLVWKAH